MRKAGRIPMVRIDGRLLHQVMPGNIYHHNKIVDTIVFAYCEFLKIGKPNQVGTENDSCWMIGKYLVFSELFLDIFAEIHCVCTIVRDRSYP